MDVLIIVFGGKIMKNKDSLQTDGQTYRIMPAEFSYRMLIMFFVLLVAGGVFCGSAAAYDDIQYAQNLSDALNISLTGAAYANGDTVYLLQDVPLNYTINITAENPITLTTVDSAPYTIFRNVSSVSLFNISSGTFILEGNNGYNLTIDGNMTTYGGANGYSLIYVNGGVFDLNTGSVLQNSTTSSIGGGGVYLNDGTFNMNGGDITKNNADNSGGGVFANNGTFNINGGSISNNTAGSNGGGVDVYSGTVAMNGGNIFNNTAGLSGGGVEISYGTFNMNGGNITNNNADYCGGGVNQDDGMFTMNGGNISENTAGAGGGGVEMNDGTFNMNGGNISNNAADYSGGGVEVNDGVFNFDGGTIFTNTAEVGGGGVDVNGGTFNIKGSATVDQDNDVYLNVGTIPNPIISVINVTGVLSSGAGTMNITPGYTNVTIISYNNGVSLGTWTSNFALNQTWASSNPTLALGQSGTDILLGTNCSVNFSINDTTLYLSQYNVSGALLAEPADPARAGYTFNGWNNTSASGTPWNFTADRIVGNTDLYANWSVNPTPTPTPVPTRSSGGNGGNTDTNADAGSVSPDGTFTTNDGGLTIHYPAGSSIIVTVFPDYFGQATAPSGISYLYEYDVYSTAGSGTSVTLVFRVNESVLEEKGVTPENVSILHYYDGEWHTMTILSIGHVDGEYLYTVTSAHTSPFMVAYNINASLFPVEGASTPTSTPTTGPTVVVPTSTTTPTQTPSSPLPIIGIIAGLGAVALLMRRE